MDNVSDFKPDWSGIVSSTVWQEQIEPWLHSIYMDGLERRAGPFKAPLEGPDVMTMEEFHFWRGWCAAIKAIGDSPSQHMEMARQAAEASKREQYVEEQNERKSRSRHSGF